MDARSGRYFRPGRIPGRALPSFLAAALAILAGQSPASSASEEELIKVRMEAAALGKGLEARNNAVRNAEREIVTQVLKTAVASEHFPAVQPILDNVPRYIRSTQLLRYETIETETRVEIESLVRRKEILREAAALVLPRLAAPPSVLVLVAERTGGDQPFTLAKGGAAENAILEALRAAGPEVVDTGVVRAYQSEPDLLNAVQGLTDVAAAFARQGFADVVALGETTVTAEPEGTGSAILENKAKVVVRVFRARDGKCINVLSQEALVHSKDPGEGGTAALQDACEKLAPDIATACVIAVTSLAPSTDTVITVEQPGQRTRWDAFANAVGEAGGGAEVEILFYSDTLARLRVRYTGLMTPFLDRLTKRSYEGTGVEIVKALQRAVTMRFVRL